MTGPEPQDPGHLLPDDAWARVVAGAEQRAQILAAAAPRPDGEEPEEEPSPRGRLLLPDRTIRARSHGGAMIPRLGVLHSAETPLRAGYAYSIAANWFATQATTSATVMIDPVETIRLLPDTTVAYHAGPKVNGFSVGVEQAGYARYTEAEWTTPDGLAQMANVAEYLRDCRDSLGLPLRWCTDAQIRAAAAGGPPQGWCTHDDVRRVLGGTTHTDPGKGYPRDRLMALAVGATQPAIPAAHDTEDDTMYLRVKDAGLDTVGLLSGGILTELTGAEARDAQAATNNWTRQAGSAPFQWVTRATWERLYQWTMLQLGAQRISNPQLITRDGKPAPAAAQA